MLSRPPAPPPSPQKREGTHTRSPTTSPPSHTPNATPQHQDPDWTRAETDALLELCDRFDLRWPVIHDRYLTAAPPSTPTPAAGSGSSKMEVDEKGKEKEKEWKPRSIEDLQARYYGLRRTLRDARRKQEQEEALAKGLPPPQPMNITGFDEVRGCVVFFCLGGGGYYMGGQM